MNLKTLLFTENACYKAGRIITPKGIMVHSTGANNPNLKRYVGPNDGLLGVNQYNNHWNQDRPDGRQVCVHAFIGKLADESIATYQTLPWNQRGWHGGSGKKGSVNDTHIGFEICEDGLTDLVYFRKVYQEAVELCSYLCKLYSLDPMGDGVIIGHYEGHKRGIASNHGDPANWFPKHGKSMDTFRKDVQKAMHSDISAGEHTQPVDTIPTENQNVNSNMGEGVVVEFKSDAEEYHPGSSKIPAWVIRDYFHTITQIKAGGETVTKGGKHCVLLGKKINKKTGIEEIGINTWVDKDVLSVANITDNAVSFTYYTVKPGDSLWKIAASKLGNGSLYTAIKTLNDLVSDSITTGQVLKIPKK